MNEAAGLLPVHPESSTRRAYHTRKGKEAMTHRIAALREKFLSGIRKLQVLKTGRGTSIGSPHNLHRWEDPLFPSPECTGPRYP